MVHGGLHNTPIRNGSLIDFGTPIQFNEIQLNWEYAYGKEYLIQVSNDNLNWTTIITRTNGSGGFEKYNVQANARYLRIYGTKRMLRMDTRSMKLKYSILPHQM